MAEETTVRNVRAPKEIFDRLAAMTKDNGFANQGAALEALLNTWQVQTSKDAIPAQRTAIEDFDSHLQAIERGYIHALDLAQGAEARALDNFRAKLEALEAEKAELRKRAQEAEEAARMAKSAQDTALTQAIDAKDRAEAAEKRAATLETALEAEKKAAANQIEDKQRLIDTLTNQLADAHEDAQTALATAAEADNLKKQLAEANRALTDAQTAATVAAAKATAAQAEAVAAVQRETTAQILNLTTQNATLQVELEKAKAQITLLSSPYKAQETAKAEPMSDQLPPKPEKDTSNTANARTKKPQRTKTKTTKKTTPPAPKEAIPGLQGARDLINEWDKYQTAFSASFDGKDAVGGMTDVTRPSISVDEYLKVHPVAAAYLQAEKQSLKTNIDLANIGKRALDHITANPNDYAAAIQQMDADISAFSDSHMWD